MKKRFLTLTIIILYVKFLLMKIHVHDSVLEELKFRRQCSRVCFDLNKSLTMEARSLGTMYFGCLSLALTLFLAPHARGAFLGIRAASTRSTSERRPVSGIATVLSEIRA